MTTIDTALLTSTSYDLSTTESNDYVFTSLDGSKVAMDYSIDGNDLVAKASEKVSYILKATVGTAGVVDAGTHEYAVNDVIELKLAKSGDVGAKPNTWMWQSTTAYNVDAQGALLPGETEKHYIYFDIEEGDLETTGIVAGNFGIGELTFSAIDIYRVVGETETKLTGDALSTFATNYNTAIAELDLAGRSAVNKKINDLATTPAEYTFVNYAKEGVTATVNVTDKTHDSFDLANYDWVVKADEDDEFIGTRLGETADSTIENELFALGTGNDKINFTGNFGDDTVVYTAGEELALNLGNNASYIATVEGDDVVLTANDYYYAEFTVTADATWDSVKYKAGETYRLDLVKVGKSSNEAALPSGSYAWGYAAREATAAEQAAGYKGKIYLYADLADVNDGNIGGLGAGNAKITYHHVTTAGDNVVTKTAIYGSETVADVATLATKNDTLYNAQAVGTVTISGMAKYNIADNNLKVNDTLLTNLGFTPSVDKKGTTFTGSRFNDYVESTEEKETFDLKTGVNKVRFSGEFGDDTVKLTAKENLNLAFDFNNTLGSVVDVRNVLSYSTKGNDLVISADNSYKLTATFTEGSYDNIKYTAGTYQFELKQVKSESDAVNGGYAWICTGKLNKDGTVDTTQVVAREATAAEKALGYETVSMILDKSDFANATSTAGGVTISGIKVTQTVKGEEHDVTPDYKAVVTAGGYTDAQYKAFNKDLFNDQLSGSITVKNYAGKDTEAFVSLSDNANPYLSINMTIQAKGNKFTGTVLDDTAVSKSANETFDLKTSLMGDEIQFSGNFGKDTVKMNADENLNLDIKFNDTLNLGQTWQDVANMTVNGTKLELSANVEYILKATVSADGWVDNEKNVIKKGDYEFVLAKSGDEGAKPNTWMWRMQDAYNVDAKGKIQDGSENKHYVYMDLENGDFTVTAGVATLTASNFDMTSGANLHFSSLELVQRLNGDSDTDTVITTNYYNKLQTLEDKTVLAQRSALNEAIYDDQLQGSITVNNFNNGFTWAGVTNPGLSINNANISTLTYEIEADKKNKFTGTVMNDVANSTVEAETFDLKSSMGMIGGDTINFTGDFGDDTVTLNKGETINLNFGDNATYTYEVAGKDLKITANDTVTLKATVGPNAKVDGYDVAAGDYELSLVKSGSVGEQANKYMFQLTPNYNGATAAEPHYVYIYLDTSDFNVTGTTVTSIKDQPWNPNANTNITLTGLQLVHTKSDGTTEDYAQTYYNDLTTAKAAGGDAFTYAESLYNAQAVGTVILKDYAAKDTGATIYVNDATHTNPAFEATFNKGVDDVVKGKVTGSSAADVVNVSAYVSADGVKGLTINTGSGNDNITGTSFNDTVTVKSLAGQTATVNMAGGTNKVTLGKGDDVYTGTGFASTTVTAGVGDNNITLGSVGTNKVTAKNGDNTVAVTAGSNTITLGNADKKNALGAVVGFNTIGLSGGQNKVTSGKGVDKYTIAGGNNVINSGAGEDTFTYTGAGYNTIKTGAGDKTFTGIAGTNNITTGKGDDEFAIISGKNIIKSNAGDDTFTFATNSTTTPGDYTIVDGGAGNDIYDVSAFAATDKVSITDKAGTNTIVLGGKETIFFDVTNVKTDKAGVVKSYKIGNEMLFSQNDTTTAGADVTYKAGKNGATNFEAQIGASTYNINLDAVASAVAGWLANTDYKSAYDALNNAATDDKVADLIACYTSNAAQNYVDPSALA